MKDSVALDFMLDVLSVVKTEKGSSAVLTLLKRSGLGSMLDLLLPTNKRTPENMKNAFISTGQPDIVTYLAGLENAGAKKDIQRSRSLPSFSSWSNVQHWLREILCFLYIH